MNKKLLLILGFISSCYATLDDAAIHQMLNGLSDEDLANVISEASQMRGVEVFSIATEQGDQGLMESAEVTADKIRDYVSIHGDQVLAELRTIDPKDVWEFVKNFWEVMPSKVFSPEQLAAMFVTSVAIGVGLEFLEHVPGTELAIGPFRAMVSSVNGLALTIITLTIIKQFALGEGPA